MMVINSYIDHSLLKPTTTPEEIVELCKEALKYIELRAHRIGTSSGVSIVFANQNAQL